MIGPIILALVALAGAVRAQQTGCDTKADVTFLLDSSANVGKQNFDKQLNFIKDVTNKMQIGPNKVQVSAVTYGTGATNQFYLNQHSDKASVDNAILNIPFKGGPAMLPNAIRYATGTSFSPVHGGRGDAPHVAVVLTNEPSGSIDMVKLESQTARDNGLIMYTVGVGGGIDINELQAIASDPDTRHLFTAQNFDALGSLSDLLATKICNELPPDPSMLPAPTGCLQKADLVFMVDSSSSVGSTNYQKLEHFLKDVVSKLDVGPNKVQVGMVKYGSYPSVEFPLGQYHTRPEVMKQIEAMTYLGGGTNDADALRYTGQQVFSQNAGARGGVPRIGIVITDGGSANPGATVAAADKLRTENIGLMAVGVGNRVNHAELNSIADKPSSDNVFTVNSYDNLDSITNQIINAMCKVQSTQPSLTTSSPGATLPPDPCQDTLHNCDQYGKQVCTDYDSWSRQNCARTCGFCSPLFTASPPKCEDNLPNCNVYGRDKCSQAGSFVQTNCQLFCGLCGVNTSSTGYYGQCSYKGKTYKTGQKWYDGCDYECTCEDGSTGRYKCNNRCPVYNSLPSDCTLVAQAGDCCLKPVCNFNPTVNVQQSSGHGKTPTGIDVCVYKTKQYIQGQTWRDGCDFQCRCVDAKKGLYRCEDLCPSYSSIPPYCHMEKQAGQCCSKPVCEFDTQIGSFQGSGSISGNGVGATPTAHPPCVDAIATCNMYGKSVCQSYRGWASDNCRSYCNMCPDELPKPGPNDRCVYNAKAYQQGQSWNASCDTTCTCENAIYGYYRCQNTCPSYNNIPSNCHVAKKAGACCPTLECDTGYFLSSSNNIASIGNGGAITVVHPPTGMTQVQPTLTSGAVAPPGTGGTGFQAPTIYGCLYNGKLYVQDQVWEDGCDYSCLCKDAGTGLYSCNQKCPDYPALHPSCHMVPDENDVCCKKPKCNPDPVTHQIPVPIPVLKPAVQSHGLVEPPTQIGSEVYTRTITLVPTGFTVAPPTAGAGHPGGIGVCTYRGQTYTQGQIWEDGCDFNCVCDDASRGHYSCKEKCVHYNALPDQCYLIKDPSNPCCDIPRCSFPVNFITHIGEVKTTTPRPQGEFCVYEGTHYSQGQTWYDGCSYKCTCEDASANVYRCLSRCPEYENVPEGCAFVTDPRDASCCQMPNCKFPGTTNVTTGTGLVPTPAPAGTYTGQGIGRGYCEYKEVQYTQGQTWQDGCDLTCTCTDAETGLYRCKETCDQYVNLPKECTLITDFKNPCCKVPRCNFPSVTQGVTGTGTTLAPTPPAPGQSPSPVSTPAPHYKYCVYKGVQYAQGREWEDGCQYRCRCDNADKGLYVCSERCASYDNVPEGCMMVTSPDDSCCLIPSCNPTPGSPVPTFPGQPTPAPTPYRIPTAAPGSVTGSANVPTPRPGQTPAPLNYCEYKGQQYSQGQKWDDGCEFTCECIDANTGKYKCLEKCVKYPSLPANCRLSKDPANPCCQVPECVGEPTPAPPTGPTSAPSPAPKNVCVYKGVSYTKGQKWYDGCDYVCNCEDEEAGLYRCNNRCPTYDAATLPPECRLVASASDPVCCKEPKCTFQNTKNQTGGYLTPPTPPPGVIDGGVATPTPLPTPSPSPGSFTRPTPPPQPHVCVYKGNQYKQGQQWNDGCDYYCECLDAMAGHYRCTEMCPKYDDLPAGCRLITDQLNPCCKKAYCPAAQVPTPAPPGVSTQKPTPAPKSGCMYNGVLFKQGQQWNDGCDLQCVCEDQMSGFYRCNDRCNNYDVPAGCSLVTDPRDSCCKVPYCPTPTTPKPWKPGMIPTPAPGVTFAPNMIPTPAPGRTYAPGMYPTWVPGMVPTPAPGATYAPNLIPTPAPGRTFAPGMYPTYVPGMVPTPAPGMTYAPNRIPTPAPGQTYAPGKYPTYVPGMVPTPAPGYTYAPNMIPTPAPGRTYAPGKFPTYVPGMVPTPAPGYTYPPYMIPTPAPGQTFAPGKFPVITPKPYPTPAPGQTFAPYVPGMIPTPAPGQTYAPNLIPTPAPGQTYAPGLFPTYVPGMVPTPAPGVTYPPWLQPTPAPGKTYAPFHFPTYVPGMVPTPAPGMTYAPGKIPTPAPGRTYAPWNFPTYVPGMVPTPAPGMTYAPNKIPTPAPGRTYAPGQFPTYVPGMVPTPAPGVTYAPNKIPTPAPGQTYAPGKYPTYVPGMVPTPAPGVTYAPNMIPTPGPYQTYPPGQFPTWVPGMIPTPAPGVTYAPNKIPTPAPGQTYAPGYFPTFVPGMVPTPAPGFTYAPNKIPTPAPGQTYAPGKFPTWVPGMIPTPAPGVTYAPWKVPTPSPGQTYKPGYYPTYVPGMVPTPAPGMTYAPNKIPTPAPGQTFAPGKYPTYVPGMVPTPAPGVTYAPNKIPTPAPGQTYAPGKFPTYVPGMVPTPAPGYTYPPYMIPTPAPGQTYAPGTFPVYTQKPYPTPAPGQTFAPYVPGMIPTPAPGQTYAPNLIPTPAPGQTYAPGLFPTYVPGMVPTPAPGVTYPPWLQPTPAPGKTFAPFHFPTYVPGMVPTPAPGMTYAPGKIPTPAPGRTYAPWNFPTYVPGMVPTPAPGMTYAPNKVPTPAPGRTYAPGQFPTWVPGMVPTPAPGATYAPNKIPTPAPGQTYPPGMFPTYVPGMVPTPAPGMTYAPNKIPTPGPYQTYAPGQFPTYVPGMVPTPAPGMTYAPNKVPTPAPGQTYAPGKFPTYVPGMVPTPAPGVTYAPNMIPTPAPGQTFAPGKFPTYVPGMVPTPAPGYTYPPYMVPTPAPGQTYAPGKFPVFTQKPYPTPAPGQTFAPYVPGMIPTPAPGQTYAPNLIPTPAPGQTYAPGLFPTYVPGMVPTPAPGVTYPPWLQPTPAPGKTFAPFHFPTYVPGMVPTPAPGMTYAPGKIPTPAPGRTYAPWNFPTYVPGMVPTPAPGMTYAPNKVPTPAPGRTYAPGQFPTYVPGMVPTPAPGVTYAPNKIPTPGPGQTFAPGKFPTYVPGMVPTPAPGMTYAPNMIPTPAPGQTFAPGKFPTYVPGMVPTPAPGFTYAPNMIPTPAPGQTFAPGKFPTYVPGMKPTPAPGYTYPPYMIPTPAPGQTYAPGMFPVYTQKPYPTPAPGQTFAPYVPGMIPTPAPGQTYAPNLIPTPAPGQTYAPGLFPTYVPGMVPTPAPGVTYPPWLQPTPAPGKTFAPFHFPTYVPGMVPTPAPGMTYAPGKIPTPAPGRTYAPWNFPTYVPGMVPTPAPGMTYAPNKIPTPAPGRTYAPGQFPTYVPGMVPTPAPGVTYAPNKIPTPGPGQTYPPGKFPTYVPGMIPTPAPGFTYAPNKIPTPAPGQTYAPGKFPTYVPGMVPTPAPGFTYAPNKIPTPGPFQTYAPGMFPTYVPGMVPTPAPGYTYAPNKIPTPGPGLTYAPGQFPTWVPGMIPTPAPGVTFAPNLIPTPAPGLTYPPGMYPTWVPGMVPTPAPGQTYAPNKVPTPAPGYTYPPGRFPTPAPSPNPFPVPTAIPGYFQGSGVNGNRTGCVHFGVIYRQGEKWQDGCKYDCECLDEHTGRYQCKERCPLFLNIPSYCRLVVDPNDACCKIPVCATPAPQPSPRPTPGPGVNPTPAPSPGGPTPAPGPNPNPTPQPTPQPKTPGCVMDGKIYVAGQSWYNGCEQRCVCEDGMTGFYRCFDRCNKFPSVPSGCSMVPDPKDPVCCEVPQCIPVPRPGHTVPTGIVPITGVPGVISGSGAPPTPGPFGQTSAPRNVCIYGGRQYTQGQKWQDGCKYECICDDAMTGKYTCTQRCSDFPLVPPQCKLQRDPKDICCFIPVCDFNQTVPSLAPFPQSTIQPAPGVSTVAPNTLPPSFCVYNGVPYRQGQTWNDGCVKKCRCDDADMNIYTCFDRCKSYNNLASGCVMVADPMDSCCTVPKCTYVPTPMPPVTKGPGVSTMVPPTAATPCPYPMPTAVPGVISGAPQPDPITGKAPSNVGFCEYRGVHYGQGQTWDDGCSYTCRCIDVNSGQYQCQEKCPRYVGIPSYCKMVQDPNNKCCTKPACDVCPNTPVPGIVPTPGPHGQPTPQPPKEVCVMNGNQYTQGQKWYDGCKQTCICDDGKTGAYTCTERCPSYQQKAGCTMVPDPRDPVCCLAPKCGNTQTGVIGTINGSGTPAPIFTNPPGMVTPSAGPTPGPAPKVCVYNGKSYTQGQKWQDGCMYDCECVDAMSGNFRCTDRCPRYPNLPSTCNLVYDPADPCCKKPDCNSVAPTPGPGQPTPGPGQPTPGPTPSPNFCVYQGVALRQGQTFRQGCDKVCRCEDAMTGKIVCDERCPTYPALPNYCTLVTDPKDQCCQIPRCTNPNTGTITGVPGSISGSNLPQPNLPGTSGSRSGCVYNNQVYHQGQTWDDGCTYTCECLDEATGRYRCTEKCARMPQLPSYCRLVQDSANRCCQKPFCTPLSQVTPQPSPGGPTPAPATLPPNVCVYKGSAYQQGQEWYDGCNAKCRCDDASKNFYRCQQRCATYTNVQPGCRLVPDPADPTCCQIPSCPIQPPTGPNPTPGIYPITGNPGGVVTGVKPTPTPGATIPPQYRKGCVYKNQIFHQGQRFDDGCDYECECLDEGTGRYRCVEKCQKYSALPPQCVLVQDPKKPCCQVPYCDFKNPTPFPGGLPTPKPNVQPTPRPGVPTVAPLIPPSQVTTPVPGVNPTPRPQATAVPTPKPQGFCVYKGVYYTQGQTWDDGCNQRCRCEDVMRGYYTCTQRCASYPASTCPMKTDPADSCCLIPDCNAGSIPTPIPTPGPGQSTINPFVTPRPITGSVTGNSGGNPVVVPGPGSGTSGSTPACVYKGAIYRQGQKWQDGCSYNCECVDAVRGQYRCTDRCGKYPFLPPQCVFKQSPTDACCQVADCPTYIQPTTVAPVTVNPVSVTGPTNAPITVSPATQCIYTNNRQYPKGATWQDGCSLNCECIDPASNNFRCTNRCPVFSGLPAMCTLIVDPADRCCKKPQCTLPSGSTLTPLIGTGTSGSGTPPTSLQVVPIGTHTVFSGYSKPQPGSIFAGRDRCVYKNTIYQQGQSWDDGCNYVCTCENAAAGLYRCTSKCPLYPTLPNYCKKVKVPGQCCESISCDIPGYGNYNPVPQLVPTPAPPSGGTTPDPFIIVPNPGPSTGGGIYPGGGFHLPNASNPIVAGSLRDKCVYKNYLYNQGETWQDGCDYSCQCMDGRTGYYVCNPLCPVYNNLPSNKCYLVKAYGECCAVPMCYNSTSGKTENVLTSNNVFPVVGTYTGGFSGFRPGYKPPGVTGTRNGCLYKGVLHGAGQTWDDGCDFACTCVDASSGLYQCNQKCPTYTKIPPICKLTPIAGSCCKRVSCPPVSGQTLPPNYTTVLPPSRQTNPAVDPNCYDKLDNCKDYGQQACDAKYGPWAHRNCNMTCGFCTPAYTTAPPKCEDRLSDCATYGMTSCHGVYEPWAKDNCRKFCGLCSNIPGPTSAPMTTAPAAQCKDNINYCATLGKVYCTTFRDFSMQNCQKFCDLCPNPNVHTTPTPTSGIPVSGWTLFLKGVAGAQGPDIYQLWHSNQTLNPNNAIASHLTTEFNGHYKPDYSNHWNDYCIDKVKVSIYNQGVEKANLIFDATGTDKNGWFRADRIISSTWTDIQSAAKDVFSMRGDTTLGREFYLSGSTNAADKCDSFGWMMISTKSSCFFEYTDPKPAFYYAPGTSQAHWGFTNPGKGDVFAIQAHTDPNCGKQVTNPHRSTAAPMCTYKGNNYMQGQSWKDGCEFNCTCEDAGLGFYRCRNLCPQYTNIPTGCKLETPQGKCCPEPICSGTTQQPFVTFKLSPSSGCSYKGQKYAQGQTWDDGCLQSCSCTDGNLGLYSCRALCLNWDSLPPSCHMDPPSPGLCCQQPKCPSNIRIQVPSSYKDQYPGYQYV